jgi:hypothetical protein
MGSVLSWDLLGVVKHEQFQRPWMSAAYLDAFPNACQINSQRIRPGLFVCGHKFSVSDPGAGLTAKWPCRINDITNEALANELRLKDAVTEISITEISIIEISITESLADE